MRSGEVQGRRENLSCLEINRHFLYHSLTDPETGIKIYNTIVLPAVLHGSENWTIEARDARRITAAEMKCMRNGTGYIWTNFKTNTDCKRTKYNTSFGQNIGMQKKLVTTCKRNAA
jgi:hypothetical protein